jgi:cell division protein ZipA
LAAELRWILLGVSLPLLGLIWWWTARRSGRTPGNAELRESTVGKPAAAMPALDPRYADSDDDTDPGRHGAATGEHGTMTSRHETFTRWQDTEEIQDDRHRDRRDSSASWGAAAADRHHGDAQHRDADRYDNDADRQELPESRDWGVPPFEPLSIRTADFDDVPVLDGPMMVHADPLPMRSRATPAPEISALGTPSAAQTPTAEQTSPAAGAAADRGVRSAGASAPPAVDLQRIVTIRVCPVGETRWLGTRLMAAFETHGLAFGRYQVFHRKHTDGRSLFCVASLIEPGTFDVAEMPDQEFRGITLFAVLPGPVQPVDTLDELFETARGLAEELSGMVQDAKGMPMSPQRAAALREDIARFQAMLTGN